MILEKGKRKNIIFFVAGILFNYFGMRKLIYTYEYDNYRLKESLVFKDNESNRNMDKLDIMIRWKRLEQNGMSVAHWLTVNGYKNVSIYGLGEIGELLVKELLETNIKIIYIIDKNKGGERYQYIPVINLQQDIEAVDCIIVTTVRNFEEIQEQIEKKGNFLLFELKKLIQIIEKEN